MISLRVAPIVEGYGEVESVPTLLRSIRDKILENTYVEVLKPIRRPRTKLLRCDPATGATTPNEDEIARAVGFATLRLLDARSPGTAELALLLLDADKDCPRDLAPELSRIVRSAAGPGLEAYVVLANPEYETWFVAAAASLEKYLKLSEADRSVADPESKHLGKGWIRQRFRGPYSETVDQPRLTATMDLATCRAHSPSFDKLCRVLERLAPPHS